MARWTAHATRMNHLGGRNGFEVATVRVSHVELPPRAPSNTGRPADEAAVAQRCRQARNRRWRRRYAAREEGSLDRRHPARGHRGAGSATDPGDPGAFPPPGETPAPAQPAKASRRPAIIIIGVIVVFLAVVLFAVRNNAAADELKVGECLNLPNGTTFQTVEKQPCTESHAAEVIFVGEYTGATYPISLSLDSYIEEQCVPAFEAYVGRAIDSEPGALARLLPSVPRWMGRRRADDHLLCLAARRKPDDGVGQGQLARPAPRDAPWGPTGSASTRVWRRARR